MKALYLAAGLVALASLGNSQPAGAAVITFFSNNEPGWSAAVGGSFQTETFSSTTLNPGLSFTSTAGSISGGVFNDRVVHGGANTTWNFATPISGFGGNWDLSPGGAGQGIEFVITLAGDGTLALTTQVPNTFTGQFFGFTSDTPIIAVEYDGGTQGGVAESYTLDNLVYAAAAVPEPASITLLGIGLAGLGFARWRRRKSV